MTADRSTGAADLDEVGAAFDAVRPRLFGIAYRMLGSATEAEDVVQDAWLRWQACDRSQVVNATAFLVTTTTRLAMNLAQSARARRESYVGEWLPEPVDTSADPALGAVHAEALELGILVLLERLSPGERAAYVLREAFDYDYAQIAGIVQVSEVNARQLVSRARKHIAASRRAPVSAAEQRRLLGAFLVAARAGDLAALEEVLATDVVSVSDGGGVVRAARVTLRGRERVAKVVVRFADTFWDDVAVAVEQVNGQPALVLRRQGAVTGVVAAQASPEGIDELLWLVNPGKLTGVGA